MGRDWRSPKAPGVFTYRELITHIADDGTSERQLGTKIQNFFSKDEEISRWILSADAFAKKTTANTPAQMLQEGAPEMPRIQMAERSPGSRVAGWRSGVSTDSRRCGGSSLRCYGLKH